MIGKLANLMAYKKAPTATYLLKHPVKGTKRLVAAKGVAGLATGKTGAVLGTIAAIPLGVWAVRRARAS